MAVEAASVEPTGAAEKGRVAGKKDLCSAGVRCTDCPVKISVIIPARNEEAYLPECLQAVAAAAVHAGVAVETLVVLNRCTDRTEEIARAHGAVIVREDEANLSRIRNAGAAAASGEILVTVDADSRLHPLSLREIVRKLGSGRYIGGGSAVLPERLSLGIVVTMFCVLPRLIRHGVSYGSFWTTRENFAAIGGFDPAFITIEDVDFARRLRALGRQRGLAYGILWRTPLVTSCRKFDTFGDWYLVRHPDFLRRVFTGTDRAAADQYWYQVDRGRD
jgi:glycosyltransferase involved in cell wall biosynthesis